MQQDNDKNYESDMQKREFPVIKVANTALPLLTGKGKGDLTDLCPSWDGEQRPFYRNEDKWIANHYVKEESWLFSLEADRKKLLLSWSV